LFSPGTFLVNNYKQAIEILDTEEAVRFAMNQAGTSIRRLDEERAYLQGLSKEPESETDQMEYYSRLVTLSAKKFVAAAGGADYFHHYFI
jgi:hypothetical protein